MPQLRSPRTHSAAVFPCRTRFLSGWACGRSVWSRRRFPGTSAASSRKMCVTHSSRPPPASALPPPLAAYPCRLPVLFLFPSSPSALLPHLLPPLLHALPLLQSEGWAAPALVPGNCLCALCRHSTNESSGPISFGRTIAYRACVRCRGNRRAGGPEVTSGTIPHGRRTRGDRGRRAACASGSDLCS